MADETGLMQTVEITFAAPHRSQLGPELELPGYGCEDHFSEQDTVRAATEPLHPHSPLPSPFKSSHLALLTCPPLLYRWSTPGSACWRSSGLVPIQNPVAAGSPVTPPLFASLFLCLLLQSHLVCCAGREGTLSASSVTSECRWCTTVSRPLCAIVIQAANHLGLLRVCVAEGGEGEQRQRTIANSSFALVMEEAFPDALEGKQPLVAGM